MDIIALRCDFPIYRISGLLLNMELKGVVRPLPGKLFEAIWYCRYLFRSVGLITIGSSSSLPSTRLVPLFVPIFWGSPKLQGTTSKGFSLLSGLREPFNFQLIRVKNGLFSSWGFVVCWFNYVLKTQKTTSFYWCSILDLYCLLNFVGTECKSALSFVAIYSRDQVTSETLALAWIG